MADHRSYTIVDVFTEVPLEGNPVAVFDDGSGLSASVMQRVARELNLSETVFVLPSDDLARADARVRIFTPFVELPFAGHPVLGTAFVLGASSDRDSVALLTGAGLVPVALTRSGAEVVYGSMEQPVPVVESFPGARAVLSSLGVGGSELPVEAYRNGPVFVYVALPDEDAVAALSPDLTALARVDGITGVSCFASAGAGDRYEARVFCPSAGVPEDPATGSAAGPLAVHLARYGRIAYGIEIEIRQGAEIGRPSVLRARVSGSRSGVSRVVVGGSAVVVARGEFRVA